MRDRVAAVLGSFLFGRPVDEDTGERLQEIKGLALIGLSLWLLVSLATYWTPLGDPQAAGHNWGGSAGFHLANTVFLALGLGGYLVVLLGIAWGSILCARKQVEWPSLRIFGALCLVVSASYLLQLGWGPELVVDGHERVFVEADGEALGASLPYGPGGWLALTTTPTLVEKFGNPGLWILLVLSAVLSFMLATEMAFYPAFAALFEWLEERRDDRGEGLGAALWSWTRGLVVGLWDFVRGADLLAAQAAGVATATRGKGGGKSGQAKGAATSKGSKSKAKSKAKSSSKSKSATAAGGAAKAGDEAGEWEYVDDDGSEGDEEWEYEDDGEQAEADEEEWEYEDDEGAEDGEWEYEDEEEVEPEEDAEDEPEDADELDDEDTLVPAAASAAKPRPKMSTKPLVQPALFEPPTPPPGPWKYPPLDLLERPEGGVGVDDQFLEDAASKLENALKSFRVEAEVVAAQVGPAVTMFELTVSQGTRMNKVTQLSQEIAAALRARSVRIIAPIPGRATIGIEVPNAKRRVVRLSELISQSAYDKKFAALPLFLGMDAEGTAIVTDLSRMPHLLIAGTTGSGKSVCINTILASLLLTRSPHDVKMILVDPKMVELQMFQKVPHLMLPVVTDMRQATNVLLWACEKMEGRYELFRDVGVKNIKGFNALGEEGLRERLGDDFDEERTPRHMPYIVLVIDEMADLMMTSKKEAEGSITRLAQKSRAVGIHVIVATQRPSTDVITGVLKGNLPTRIAFQVASKVDSRVILDAQGAEKLLGGGDMLYTPPQTSQLKRVQGALVEDHELQAIVDFVCQDSAPTFNQELVQSATGTRDPSAGGGGAEQDDLWDEAVRIILKSKRGSASLLQRALGIGYTRASRLIDIMTEEGIVGDHKGSKAREVLLTLDDWESMTGAAAGQGASDE